MKSLKHLNKYLWKYRWRLTLGIVFIAISKVFAIYPAQVIRHAFDDVKQHMANTNELTEEISQTLLIYGGLVIGLALLNGFFLFLTRQAIIAMSRLIEFDLKNEIYDQYQQLDHAFYKRNNTGDLMNRISEDVSRVRMYLGPSIMYSINLAILFILVIATMLSVNVKLTLFCLLPLPILSITIYYVSNIINRKSERVQWQLSNLSTFAQEAFSGIRVLKAYTREESSQKAFEKENEVYKSLSLELVKTNALFHPIMILLIGLSTILTIYIGGLLAINGEITMGNIAEFVIYVNMLTWPVAALGWVTSLVQRAAASQERINEFLNTKPEIKSPANEPIEITGKIEFKNVDFTYPDTGIKALKNVSFEVEPGKSLAIIGRTGSGKSTIANLIGRLYDVNEGEILIDGKNITKVNLSALRNSIGYVPQEVFLFSDTIKNNIAFGVNELRINANRANNQQRETSSQKPVITIQEAAKAAAIYSNIMEFPKQFDTMVGERGITLSGGQKQRVSIARALIKSPQILIFDDCLSAVDTETEEEILSSLKQIMRGKTTVIISHRVSSVKHCDNVILLDDGSIAEFGNHSDLLDKKGIYFDLYQKQLLEEEKISV
ncbi:ABC transporter ATP-binding protein [Bacteroidales bacterium AH-315-I05]|nr:ABC transporter ATP-binding protein [Bacteroidales bacterium AH-315-I05]